VRKKRKPRKKTKRERSMILEKKRHHHEMRKSGKFKDQLQYIPSTGGYSLNLDAMFRKKKKRKA